MRGKKFDTRAVVLLAFGLTAVLLIMWQLRLSTPKPPAEITRLEGKRIGIVDSTYINLPFRFMIKMPNQYWHLSILRQDTILAPLRAADPIEDQILWLVQSWREEKNDALATMQIGVLDTGRDISAKDLSINYLAELIAIYEKGDSRLKILQQVTTPAHPVLKGAYFVGVLPGSAHVKMPVWIVAMLPRGEWCYIIRLETTEESYNLLRRELGEMAQRFFPLPSMLD